MYRVELKDKQQPRELHRFASFLMYRVELKEMWNYLEKNLIDVGFLMYRVELKVFMFGCSFATILPVPNVPCGVKRSLLRGWLANLCLVPNVPCGVERS